MNLQSEISYFTELGMQDKAKQFKDEGAEIYRKA